MELTIMLLYLGYPAHYLIKRDAQGIYHARLTSYEGPDAITPPEDLTLTRGIRQWIGSYDEAWFVAELGRALEMEVALFPGEQRPSAESPHQAPGTTSL